MELNVGIKHIIDGNAIIIMGQEHPMELKMLLVTFPLGLVWQVNFIKNVI